MNSKFFILYGAKESHVEHGNFGEEEGEHHQWEKCIPFKRSFCAIPRSSYEQLGPLIE